MTTRKQRKEKKESNEKGESVRLFSAKSSYLDETRRKMEKHGGCSRLGVLVVVHRCRGSREERQLEDESKRKQTK